LFSKVQTGKSVWTCTAVSLTINLIFKFVTPFVFGLSLNRTEEMLVGALLPFALLGAYELYARQRSRQSVQYQSYVASRPDATSTEAADATEQNTYGIRVMAITLTIISVLIITLGLMSGSAVVLVTVVGAIIFLVAGWLFRLSNRN
jgi:hypothetical protein